MTSKTAQNKKIGLIRRIQDYVRGIKSEGRKVTWPTRSETIATTGAVFVMMIIATLFLFATDSIMALIVQWIIGLGS